MGSHKRSFQCFDAILDDPSLKPSLSYGHQSAGSHMSSAAFNRLEPLEDRGCYLCADHQQATSMTSEASGANSTPWYHFQTHPHSHRYMTRRPARPEETTGEFEDHPYHHHKHSSRIVLVKNSDPSVRRTIVLHRRSLRSLGLFMDEVSELMQCLIRKLYTLDGNKVDSVQSLLHCVGILVCVGREPFHPLLLDSFRKNSNDKLPKLNIKSRSSAGSDDNGAKKNVNFGLETKRSIIHPRCDSSNRSARLASSEKLFPNGLNSLPPGHAGTCPRAREGMMDDDIEKRVLVNKDGSLSMEMKVRFRLLHDETLHWSTEIKKSTSTLNECHTAHDDACCLSYGSADSCSEVESLSAGEAEETYNTKRYQKHFEEPHCYHCCAHCQEYDIWKNPILPHQTAVRHIRSSSSSASSRKLVRKKASTDSMHTMSSEEYTEHVVEKVEQTFGNQSDTSIKHCTIHCCCRQSQVCLVSAKPKSTGSTEKKYKVPEKMEVSDNDENKPDNSKDSQKEQLSVQIAQPVVEDERPLSTISSSSQILASFKEDQDEEDVDILPSISRASLDSGQQEDEDGRDAELNPCSATRFRSLASMTHLSPKPPNKTSPLGRSILFRKLTPKEIDVDQDDQNVRAGSAESAPSEALLGPKKFKCLHSDHTENNELMANDQQEEDAELKMYVNTGEIRERTNSEISTKSKTSTKSPSKLSLCSQDDTASENSEEHQDITDERSSSAISIKSNTSDKSGKSNVAEVLEQECPVHDERAPSAISIESRKSENSKSEMSETLPEDPENEVRTSSAMSGKSATSVKSKRSKISENNFDDLGKLHNNVEERTMSAMSCKSNISAKSSWSKEPQSEENKGTDEQIEEGASSVKSAMSNRSGIEELKDQTEERASSAISLKSNTSDRSKMSVELSELEEQEQDRVSVYSHISQKSKSEISEASSFQVGEEKELQERTASAMSATSVQSLKTTLSDVLPATTVEPHNGQPKERAQSVMSTKSSASQVESELPGERSPSSMSSISHISATSKVSEGDKEQIQAEDKVHERASSAISAKSNISSRSRKSETTPSAIERSGEDMKERTLSAMSSQSKASLRSNKSKVSSVAHEEHVDTGERGKRASSTMSTKSEVSTDVELEQRASSAISAKSNPSATLERSKMSMVGEDEVKKLQVQDDDQLSAVSYNSETLNTSNECEEKEERTPSALSTKSKTSVKSNKSKAAIKIVAEEHDLRSASTMSSKSVSAKFAKSEVSELVLEEPVETDDQIEGRTQSALSAKSNESGISVVTDEVAEDRPLSDMSSISNASKRSKKSNSKAVHQTKERAQSALSAKTNVSQKSQKSNASATADKADDKEKEERAQSAMSEQSCISTKSGISTKSEAFTISEVSLQEPDDTEREDKTPSVMSIKSSVSARSHKSTNSYGGPAEVEVHNSDRLSSAISSISNISTKSGRSITPESTHSEKETTIEPDIKERALSAMSAKSISSGRTRTSKVTEIITDEPTEQKVGSASTSKSLKSNASGRSKKSNVSEASPKNVVNEDKEKEERAASVLSSLSNVSERTKHSEIIPDVTGSYIEERAPSVVSVTSVKSKSSNISGVVPEETEITGNKDAEASVNSSNALANSNASTRSKRSFSEAGENEKRSISVLSSASAESKVSKADVEKKSNRSTSQLSAKSDVSARSKKSKVSEGKDNTPTNRSPVSGHSKVSQADSNKCVCGAVKLSPIVSSEKEEEIPASPLSTKSKISSAVTTSERALTQTSASVSIGIVDDCEVDDEGTTSVKSKTSASSETCDKSQKDLLESQRQMTKDRAITLAKSNISERSKSKHSHCSSTALDTNQRDEPSANDSVRQNFPTQEIRSSNKASSVSVHSCAGIAGQGPAESPDASHKSQSICSKCSSTQNRGKTSTALVTPTSPVSSASAVSDSKGSRKNKNSAEIVDRPNRNISKSSHLQVNDTNEKIHVEATVNSGDSHSGKSKKKCKSSQTIEEDRVRCHSATLSLTSANRLSPSPPKSPKKSKKTIIQLVGSKDSVLSQTVPDQSGVYIENKNIEQPKSNIPHRTCNGRPDTTDSIQNVSDKSEKSSKCRKRKGSTSSHQMMKDDAAELSPSCLPNSSPTEVVNEWLMKIPSDTALCDLEDEYHENFETTESLCTSHVPSGDENEHRDLKEYDVIKPEKQNNVDDAHPASAEGTVDKKSQENHAVHADDRKRIRPQAGEASKALDSSVLVMKVLLSPTIDRCNSLPEVSPVYGRKLSTSAQGLLDCLAKLQLLDFGPSDENSTKAKYQELMNMLKSLWLCDPKDSENFKDQQPLDEEFKARSSSGVDVNSGSTSSGKSSVLGCSQTKAECEGPDTLTKVQEVDETVQEEPSETPESKCKSATPYISCRARRTPEGGAKGPVEEKLKDDVTGSDETIRNNDSPRELMETPLSSNMSSGNYPQNKETETDHPEDSSSGSRPASQRPQLSKRVSQDPDPIWVLNLLNKLEMQFMTHYVNAMDEFKVRWNLDDNEHLDVMICELQDEVRKRIQCSVNRELKKIRGRAGRSRPPKEAMSRESTVQTEQRRRRLKVMRNQSVDPQPTPAKSEDEYTATGTDFSDQRSDDEYCPCDTCLKKKMASKPVVPVEMFNSAPVMMDFDLRRILQIKKSAPNNEKTKSECKVTKMDDAEENVALEAVKEEDDREVTDASSAQESEKEDDKDRKSDDCEKKEDTFEKQSDTSLKKDMNEEVEVISSMEVFEVGEMSENNMTAEQQKEAEKEKEEKADNEADSENDNLSGDVSDAMQVETERGKTKELAQEEHTEHNRYNADESENDETVDDEIAGKEQNVESVDADGSTSEKSVEQTAEAETAGETETAEDETAEEGDISEVKTASESETAEDKPAEEGDTAQDETAEEGETSEVKFAEESETAEDETAENGETSEVNSAEESKSSEAETTEVGEASEAKTAEESETAEDRAAVESETAEDETGEEGETSEVKTAEESETAEDETAENGETSEVNSAEESKTAEAETTEVGETSEAKTAEESETAEDETEEESETSEVKTAEESETAEDEIAEKSEMDEDETAEEVDISEVKTAEEYETVEDETAEKSETAEDDTLEESETAEDKAAEEGRTSQDETAEESETAEDEAAEEGEISQDETAEESETAEDKAAEEGEISQDETAEEGEISQDETAEEGETAEDKAAEEGETSQDNTAEESETAEDKAAEEGEISQDETAEESETAEDKVAEEGEISQDETAEESETAEDKAAEEGEISQDETAEESETAEDKVAEEGETSQDEIAADDDLSEAKTADENETAENESAEKTEEDGETAESETAEEVTAENSESVAIETAEDEQHSEDEATEKSETAEDDTAGDDQTAEDETAEKSQTEDETAEEGETANDDTQEELETSINASIEHDKTAGENDTAADEETAEAKSATESETLDEETATDGQSAERESAEDDKTTEDEQNVETSARNMETSDHETSDEVEPFVKDGEPAEAKTAHESEMANDEGETNDKNTNSTDNKDELVAERVTADDKSTDDDTTEDVSSKAEEVLTEDEENAGEDLSERKKTAEEDTPESHSELEEVKETVDHKKDVLSNPDDTDCDDVIDLKADKIVAEEETLFKNEGDVVIDSIDEKDKGSGKEDDVEEALGDKGCHFADIGESAEGGDEAEDDTEPDMEIDEGEHDGNVQASQSTLKPKQEDGKTVTSFDVAVNHNLVYDADVEDSETEVHNQIQELSSESESKPQKTVRKTFKMLIHTLAFLKPTATQRPKAGEEEEGDDEEEHEETPEESDNTEDSSCVEKEECRKEKGELSDITEDLEEENQETETGNTTKYYSEKSEWESSENALEKQFTMSSMESQPGSFDEVLDDEVNSQTVSNHVTAKANQ